MIARYAIEHSIEFVYSAPVRASMMTLYMRPLQDRRQVTRSFSIRTSPAGPVFEFEGCFDNKGHFFDRPGRHRRLEIRASSSVEVGPVAETPDELGPDGWGRLKSGALHPDRWLMLEPSSFVRFPPLLEKFARECKIEAGSDPLTSARELCSRLCHLFDYIPGATVVDSPVEQILATREGVCQDYAHVMASILRSWGIPTRYVSGYLGSADGNGASSGESHAWVESWFPELGWVGFDPTNDTECDLRHVRVAVGRDYADVPPTRGTFQGLAESMLNTQVTMVRQ